MAGKKRSRRAHTLTSMRQVQALAHPLRFRAFEYLIDAPRTGKQLAQALGKQPTHLYHHLRVLERAGLVRQVATQKKRGTIERYYRAVADRVLVDERLFRRKVIAKHALIGQVLRLTLDELIEADSIAGKLSRKPPSIVKRLRIRASARQAAALERRLQQWLGQFERMSDPTADGECVLTVAFYPLRPPKPA
jgi:DNA-binding transcriptional ArsR family regulator